MSHEAAAALPGAKPDAFVLASDGRRALTILARMPRHPEYITPTEILRLVSMSREYGVDWSEGLEPTGAPGEILRVFRFKEGHGRRQRTTSRRVRMRREVMLQDFQGTLVPDGDILWAWDLIGRLRSEVKQAIQDNLEGA